jgi:hypothetical protein
MRELTNTELDAVAAATKRSSSSVRQSQYNGGINVLNGNNIGVALGGSVNQNSGQIVT